MDIQQKLLIIGKKHTYKPSSYYLFQDSAGWSDGFVADLVSENSKISLMVKIKQEKNQSVRYNLDKENCPKVQNIVPILSSMTKVLDIEPTFLNDGIAYYLISGDRKELVRGEFISYFIKTYESFGEFDLYINKDYLKPVAVVKTDKIIGLIMPIRQAQ